MYRHLFSRCICPDYPEQFSLYHGVAIWDLFDIGVIKFQMHSFDNLNKNPELVSSFVANSALESAYLGAPIDWRTRNVSNGFLMARKLHINLPNKSNRILPHLSKGYHLSKRDLNKWNFQKHDSRSKIDFHQKILKPIGIFSLRFLFSSEHVTRQNIKLNTKKLVDVLETVLCTTRVGNVR